MATTEEVQKLAALARITVKDEELDGIATSITNQIQEFSTYPGAIVINLVREFQHSELKD